MNTGEYLNSVFRELASIAAQTAAYDKWSDEFSRKEIREVWRDDTAPLRHARNRRVRIDELVKVDRVTLVNLGFGSWDGKLMLIPLWAFNYIADGEALKSIGGKTAVKGVDEIDLDVRFGCVAYGFDYPAT